DAQGVLDVVPAGRGQRHADFGAALVVHLERGASGSEAHPARMPVGLDRVLRAVTLDLALRERGEALPVGKGAAGCEVAVLRQERKKLLERALVVGRVAVDVGMIELGAGEDCGPRPVMEKLGTL